MRNRTKKRTVRQEPMLNTVARKLGHAAGTLTNFTQELRENLSTLPDSVAKKVREAANAGAPALPSRVRVRHSKKRISSTGRSAKVKARPKKRWASKDASRQITGKGNSTPPHEDRSRLKSRKVA